MLTEAVRRHLFAQEATGEPLEVIPCCAELPMTTSAVERDPMRDAGGVALGPCWST